WQLVYSLTDSWRRGLLAFESYRDAGIFVSRDDRRGTFHIVHEVKQPNGEYVHGRIDLSPITIPTGGLHLRVSSRETDLMLAEGMWLRLRDALIKNDFL